MSSFEVLRYHLESMNVLMVAASPTVRSQLMTSKDENIGRFLETYRDYCQDLGKSSRFGLVFRKVRFASKDEDESSM